MKHVLSIEVQPGYITQHTVVTFDNNVTVCSCYHPKDWRPSYSKTIPNLHNNTCVVCASPSGIYFDELEEYVCNSHIDDYFDWKNNHPTYLPIDYLREQLDKELRNM